MISINKTRQCSPEPIPLHYSSGNKDTSNKRTKSRNKKCGKTVRATDEEIFLSRLKTTRVKLNVGGECHEVMWKTLKRMPFTRLGLLRKALTHDQIMEICDDYDLKKNEYYFDRHPKSFLCVLTMFRTGNLHMLEDLCIVNFTDDLNYWGINENLMESCCHHRYHMKRERVNDEIKKVKDINAESDQKDKFGSSKFDQFRSKVWDLMENPQTSIAAQIIAMLSVIFILISVISLMIGSLPTADDNKSTNVTKWWGTEAQVQKNLETVEIICITWFSFEYVSRLFSCPNQKNFLKSPMNMIDISAILPFYISCVYSKLTSNQTSGSLDSARKAIQVFRILRVLRILKLARHSTGLQALGYTLQKSYKELGMLVMFIALGVLLFSSLVYFAEKDQSEKKFVSIPATFWWAIITMTTVGYGDMVPSSFLGKFIGSFCCICGVLVIALPIPIIVNNFADYYKDQLRREKTLKRKEDMAKAKEQGSIVSTKSDDEDLSDFSFVSDEENASLMKRHTYRSQSLKPSSFSEFFKNDSRSSIYNQNRQRTASFNEIRPLSSLSTQGKPNHSNPSNRSLLSVPEIPHARRKLSIPLENTQVYKNLRLDMHKRYVRNQKDKFFKENISKTFPRSSSASNHTDDAKDTLIELLPGENAVNYKNTMANVLPKSQSSIYLKAFVATS